MIYISMRTGSGRTIAAEALRQTKYFCYCCLLYLDLKDDFVYMVSSALFSLFSLSSYISLFRDGAKVIVMRNFIFAKTLQNLCYFRPDFVCWLRVLSSV